MLAVRMEPHHEIEMKFEVPDEVELFRLATLLQRAGGTPTGHQELELRDVYFDTDDQALARQGMGCRLRWDEKQTWITVKSQVPLENGIASRDEWEEPLPQHGSQTTFPNHLDLPTVHRALALADHTPLRPLLVIEQRRTVCDVEFGESIVEVAADRVMTRAGAKTERSAQVELELKQGHRSDLETLAAVLGRLTGWMPASQSKLERGMVLLGLTTGESAPD